MTLLFSNNSEAVLAEEIFTGTTVFTVVADGSENTFRAPQLASPAGEQLATLSNTAYPGVYEVIRITSRTGNEFTVERGVERITESDPEGRTIEGAARYWPAGTKMSARVTAGTLAGINSGVGVIYRPNSITMGVTVAADDYQTGAVSSNQHPYSLVFEGRSRVYGAIQLSGKPTLQLENAAIGSLYNAAQMDLNSSYPSVGGTFPVDLGTPATWSSGYYFRGSVVIPTAPDGYQYWPEIDDINAAQLGSATEPVWATVDGTTGGVEVTSFGKPARWRRTAMPIEFEMATYVPLVITEVGFIAHKVSATAVPSVSIGTAAVPGRFASNVALSQITGNGCVHRIPVTGGGTLANELRYKVDTAATGGRFLGRFYWRGFFVELME